MNLAQRTPENRLRRAAARAGYGITKSRRALSLDNFGDYMLFDASSNFVVFGSRYDANLADIDRFLHPPKKARRKRKTAKRR
jgi:hypothetical protein